MEGIRIVFAFLFFYLFPFMAGAQSFFRAVSLFIDPRIIMPEYYFILPLPLQKGGVLNVIDRNNPYSSVELIMDPSGKLYQILWQTDFSGVLTCLAVSKNLENRLMGKNRPLLAFRSCLAAIQNAQTSLLQKEAAIDCIMLQLEHPDLPK